MEQENEFVDMSRCPITWFSLSEKSTGNTIRERKGRDKKNKRSKDFLEYVREGKRLEIEKTTTHE